jgi:hypothetical protein
MTKRVGAEGYGCSDLRRVASGHHALQLTALCGALPLCVMHWSGQIPLRETEMITLLCPEKINRE